MAEGTVLTREVAEQEFNRFIETMDLDVDPGDMTEQDLENFNAHKVVCIRALCKGSLVINDDGEPVYTPQRSGDIDALTFREPSGAAYMSMDRKKRNADVAKMYGVMAEIAGVPHKTFSNMKQGDLKVCTAVTTLFLG